MVRIFLGSATVPSVIAKPSMVEKVFAVLSLIFFADAVIGFQRLTGVHDNWLGIRAMQLAFLLIYSGTALLVLPDWRNILRLALAEKSLLLLTALALLSVLWSPRPNVTFMHGIGLAGTVLFGIYLVGRYTAREQLLLLCWALGITAVLALYFAVLIPEVGIMRRGPLTQGAWCGTFPHKNVMGRAMLIGGGALLLYQNVQNNRHRLLCPFMASLCMVLLILTRAKLALLVAFGLLALAAFYLWRTHRRELLSTILLAWLITGIGLCGVTRGYTQVATRLQRHPATTVKSSPTRSVAHTVKCLPTTSDRLDLWRDLMPRLRKRPILGYGYATFWSSFKHQFAKERGAEWHAPHAHNGFIDVFLGLGLIGFAILAYGLAMAVIRNWQLWRAGRGAEIVEATLLLGVLVGLNLGSSFVLSHNSLGPILYAIVVLLPLRITNAPDAERTRMQN